MNWDDKGDGPFRLPDGWVDSWVELKPGDDCWTYDTKANDMLSGNRNQQRREWTAQQEMAMIGRHFCFDKTVLCSFQMYAVVDDMKPVYHCSELLNL
ncbi:hypothetical protein ABZP36_010385 [Zizania latifolia]